MKRFLLAPVILLVAALVLGGCATTTEPVGVSISVVNIAPTQTAMFETVAALTVRVTNESPVPLTLIGSAHKLYLNDTYVGKAVSNEKLTVPALGTATQTVSVYLENLALMKKVMELANASRPVLAYRIDSKLHPGEGSGKGTLATTGRGELDLGPLMPTGR